MKRNEGERRKFRTKRSAAFFLVRSLSLSLLFYRISFLSLSLSLLLLLLCEISRRRQRAVKHAVEEAKERNRKAEKGERERARERDRRREKETAGQTKKKHSIENRRVSLQTLISSASFSLPLSCLLSSSDAWSMVSVSSTKKWNEVARSGKGEKKSNS